jgi:hypothetical protein
MRLVWRQGTSLVLDANCPPANCGMPCRVREQRVQKCTSKRTIAALLFMMSLYPTNEPLVVVCDVHPKLQLSRQACSAGTAGSVRRQLTLVERRSPKRRHDPVTRVRHEIFASAESHERRRCAHSRGAIVNVKRPRPLPRETAIRTRHTPGPPGRATSAAVA